ncbi:F-box/LRR-repeat protein At3g58900-like [Durio zibethinus]|uniref:F-box/LRR-repeat protein At3g58900-like n=1 Tax=Durio zibethinus TaxID=66656 RepID=A0A6P5ZNR4_DURZI|nr:F-box/LRR-repeat protein At3g58900-like [Durio zibethinus]
MEVNKDVKANGLDKRPSFGTLIQVSGSTLATMVSGKPKPPEDSTTQDIAHECQHLMADRISSLPDEILVHILGFLLMKDAVATSVLSRGWRNLWKSLTTFKFDPVNKLGVYNRDIITLKSRVKQSRMQSYANWVNEVLQQLQHLRNVEEFWICSDFCENGAPYFDHWIAFAVEKKVRILNINLADDDGYCSEWKRCSFPTLSLSKEKASSVIQLSLRGVEICSPGFNIFTSLTSLTLTCLILTGDVCETAFSNCPLLEHLHIRVAYNLVNLKLVGSGLSRLKFLELYYCNHLKNVEIYAPNLVSFKYAGLKTHFAFKYVPKLVEARFGACSYYCNYELIKGGYNLISYAFSQLDSICTHFESLVLETNTMEVEGMSPQLCPTFISLKVLILFVDATCVNCIGLPSFLEACPVLSKFEVHINVHDTSIELKSRDQLSKASLSPHRFLKEIELSGFLHFLDQSYEMELVQYLVKTAVSLQKLTIITRAKCLQMDSDKIVWSKRKEEMQNARERAKQLCTELLPMAEVIVL